MLTYLAAYDTESDLCLEAVGRIVEVHTEFEVPATLFIVSRLLETHGKEYRTLIGGNPLFEIASHSSTHMLLGKHRVCGEPGPSSRFEEEIVDSKKRIEDFFGCAVKGFRTPVGFSDGLCGKPRLLELCAKAGYRYCSTLLWGPNETLPAIPRGPFTYAEDGFPDLLEIPAAGWHENVLKGFSPTSAPIQLFPAPIPGAAITRYVTEIGEEVRINNAVIDYAIARDIPHVSLVWHPWSLGRFDAQMQMLRGVFSYTRSQSLVHSTFSAYAGGLDLQKMQGTA